MYDPSDWALIEASFAQQYGIRIRHESYMPWGEFSTLLSGLNADTPFGKIIAIRSETNSERLKQFTPEARRIRNEWITKKARRFLEENPEDRLKFAQEFERAMAAAFGK